MHLNCFYHDFVKTGLGETVTEKSVSERTKIAMSHTEPKKKTPSHHIKLLPQAERSCFREERTLEDCLGLCYVTSEQVG